MENLENETADNQVSLLDTEAKSYLLIAAQWAKFLAIVGFVFVGLVVLLAFFAGSIFSQLSQFSPQVTMFSTFGTAITVLYLIMAAIGFFPCWFLFQFAHQAIKTVKNNTPSFTESFKNLKSFFKFYGILTAIMVIIYGLMFMGFLMIFLLK